jgi:recombinational DNA repair protein (RecF pathway)
LIAATELIQKYDYLTLIYVLELIDYPRQEEANNELYEELRLTRSNLEKVQSDYEELQTRAFVMNQNLVVYKEKLTSAGKISDFPVS